SAPARANSIAMDLPMPVPPPVTMAVLPSSEKGDLAMAGTIPHGSPPVHWALGRSTGTNPALRASLYHPPRRLGIRVGGVSGVLGWLATERLAPHPMTPLAAELASKHLLYGEGLGGALELVTAEPTQMGAWFQGRLGFPVRLPAGTRRPERLVGGRISSVADA